MKKLTTPVKRILALSLVFAILLAQSSGLIFALGIFGAKTKGEQVQAAYASTTINLDNSGFESPTSSSYPISPSGWSKVEQEELVVSGLINIEQEIYEDNKEDYNLEFNPGKSPLAPASSKQVLMINAKQNSSKMGYRSGSFILAKNGYYTIEVLVYTQNYNSLQAAASVYLTGNSSVEENENSKILNINTFGEWKSYKFFVETDTLQDQTLSLELYLGSKMEFSSQGAVFFDDVKITSHSHQRYYSEIDAISSQQDNYSILNLNQQQLFGMLANPDFEEDTLGWEILSADGSIPDSEYAVSGAFNVDQNFSSQLTKVASSPNNANRYNNQKALLINNINPASIGFRSSDILIEQHKLYQLSVMVKTSDIEGGATIKLIQQNPYGEDNTSFTTTTETLTNVNTSLLSNAKTGDWMEYSFLIKGNVFVDSYANLELWLGTEGSPQIGYAFFDNIRLYALTTAQYQNFGTNERVKQIDFSSDLMQDAQTLNSAFNYVEIQNIQDTYPHLPINWTIASEDEYAQLNSGIINTNPTHFNNIKNNTGNYDGFSNPGNLHNLPLSDISNNILMLGNKTSTYQVVSNSPTAILTNSYYLFSFYLQTQALSQNAVFVRLLQENIPLVTLNNLESNLEWTKYSIYLKTTHQSASLSIKLMLGHKDLTTTGFAFFDNVTLGSTTEEAYNNALANSTQNTRAIDLNKQNFLAHEPNLVNGLYDVLNYSGTQVDGGVQQELISYGVFDTANFETPSLHFPGLINPGSANEELSKVLMLNSLEDTHYTLTSKLQYNILANKYYKLSVFVKTFGLNQLEENQKKNDANQIIDFGASIKLTGFDKHFSGINTQKDQIQNDYVQYDFYIKASEARSFNLVLGLGDSEALTRGYVFFSNISLLEIEKEAYDAGELMGSSNVLALQTSTEVDDAEEEPEEHPKTNFDFLLIPTLISSIALVLAIVAYALRQVKFNKLIRRRIKSEIYDRNKSLNIEHERREVVRQRQERLAKLKEELSKLQEQIELTDQEYKLEKQKDKETLSATLATLPKSAQKVQKQLTKKKKSLAYQEKRARLTKEFERIEKEIEKLEREERLMFEKYRTYKAQVKAIKLDIKQKQKEARIKRQQAKQKAKAKKNKK